MTQIQQYIFIDSLRSLAVILSGLIIMALLTQGLSQSELLLENGQSAAIYLKVVFLGTPKILGLLIPLGMFVAVSWSLNRIHRDSEIVVAQASGMTTWQVASPVLRLAALVAILQLVTNLWLQPAAQREMRETLHEAKVDLASTLIRPGEFTTAGPDLTFYARDNLGGTLVGLIISDEGSEAADYLSTTGRITKIDEQPVLVLQDGEIHQIEETGGLSVLKFDQYMFDLAPFVQEESEIYFKASDRYLNELTNIDPTNHYEAANAVRFVAEANYRITSPLLTAAMALFAISAVLGGDYRRSGYLKRIGKLGLISLTALFLHLAANAVSVENSWANLLQWLVPMTCIIGAAYAHFASSNANIEPAPV
ncbi:MAG: LptF/LptG family permease [Pseudomonadota bacterium]